jgi:hypothetical protein
VSKADGTCPLGSFPTALRAGVEDHGRRLDVLENKTG